MGRIEGENRARQREGPDHRTLVVVSIASNAIAFIDTATNAVKHITYVGRSPHESSLHPRRQGGLGPR